MRPIKFRGRDAYGKLHYGDLWQRTDGMILFDHDETVWQRVHPESIAQFVGRDANNREVYEGDVLIDELEQEYTAEIYDRPEKIRSLKLKEASDNA